MFYQPPQGWFYSESWRHFQKVNNGVYVYVSRIIGGYKAQLYFRGDTSSCQLEVRTEKHEQLETMFQICEEWLHKYESGDFDLVHQDRYSILNPLGVWKHEREKELFWI